MTDRPTMEELAPMLQDLSDWELATLLFKCVYPSLSGRPQYTDPGLWERVDSRDYHKWVNGAKKFIQEYERLSK